MSVELLDAAGRRRSPATLPGRRRGCTPRNKGRRYPADPPRVEEIIAVMRAAGVGVHGDRIRALVVVLWRAGLRISEALALAETDLEPKRGSILVRRGKGGKRREVGMDRWAWDQLEPWLSVRAGLLVGALFCVLRGLTRGRGEALSSRSPCSLTRTTTMSLGLFCMLASLRRARPRAQTRRLLTHTFLVLPSEFVSLR